MKAYITLVTILITIGLVYFIGQLDMTLDGEEMNTYVLLLSATVFFAGVQIGLLFFPVYKEEIIEALQGWFNDEEKPEEEEEGDFDWDNADFEKDFDLFYGSIDFDEEFEGEEEIEDFKWYTWK